MARKQSEAISLATSDTQVQVAAAQVIVDKSADVSRPVSKNRVEAWQSEAWSYYDDIGELHYVYNVKANALSKCSLVIAKMENGKPVEIIDDQDNAAVQALKLLQNESGSYSDLIHRMSIHLDIPGETNLAGWADEKEQEHWRVASEEELRFETKANRTSAFLLDGPNDKIGRPLDFTVRIYQPHPRWFGAADSSMRGVLELCDELLKANRLVRSTILSRIASAGILFYPSEMTLEPADPTAPSGNGQERQDRFTKDFLQAITTAIENEGSAVAASPLLVKAPKDMIATIKHITFDRPIDQRILENRESLIRRIAQGIEYPPEVMLGYGDVNHWTGWLIDDNTWKAHLDPRMRLICSGLTQGYLHPRVVGSEDYAVWFDPTDAIEKADRLEDATALYDRIEISGDALRSAGNFTEADKPADDEVEERLRREQAKKPAQPDASFGEPQAITSAAAKRSVSSLGEQLASIDKRTFDRLMVQIDSQIFRSLEIVGAALRRKAGNNAKLKGTPQHLVALTLGREAVKALGLDEDEIIAASSAELLVRYNNETDRAQRATIAALASAGVAISSDLVAGYATAKQAGWEVLETEFASAVNDQLYGDPFSDISEDVGESSTGRAKPGMVRRVMAAAGGANSGQGGTATPWGGIAVGAIAFASLAAIAIIETKFTWDCGDPERPFEPHHSRCGLDFVSFDDASLFNDESFPADEFYFPGDHDGCQCSWVPHFTTEGSSENDNDEF